MRATVADLPAMLAADDASTEAARALWARAVVDHGIEEDKEICPVDSATAELHAREGRHV